MHWDWCLRSDAVFGSVARNQSLAASSVRTHIGPNFRIPVLAQTHSDACTRNCLEDARTNPRRLCKIAQRAMNQMTGYFSGYICKRQPVGRFQLRVAKRALPQMTSKLTLMNVCAQKAQLVNRMFSILEGRGKLRTAAEEYNLAANHRERDETHAEYISTFTPAMFNGHELLNRLELVLGTASSSHHTMLQTKKRKGAHSEVGRI